jgi:quinol monooxygenase YgiN
MGSSMSNPATFKQKNKEKHFQAYQRKYPDELISPQKIKLK